MGSVLIAVVVPTAVFGAFALLAVWLGADSRPTFDERPVHDERPNWFPISRGPRFPEADDDVDIGPPDALAVAPQRPPRAATSRRSAAISPSGV